MAVTRKPKRPDEASVQRLINKGGTAATAELPPKDASLFPILLRIPADMVAQIDAAVRRRRPVRISRQAWIIETLHERLSHE
ncbi:MAG: hypothetical protein JOZ29_15350 [Deltaproteobacteria bacterium]|nr:hypothetical protein [Deltaproteobacteria bacterium]